MIKLIQLPQIPLYRAKKIDSDEYIKGYLNRSMDHNGVIHYNISLDFIYNDGVEIDPSTLAIHFPDMIDSEGNKIFASLSEDGKGGTICEHPTVKNNDLNGTVSYCKSRFSIGNGFSPKWNRLKTTGIQE